MPTTTATPPPADPGQSSPQAGELQLALFVSRYCLLGLSCIGGALLIKQAWGPLWVNVLHFALAALAGLLVVWLWRQQARLTMVLSSLVVLIVLLLLFRVQGDPALRCTLTPEDLMRLATSCRAGAGEAVESMGKEQQTQHGMLSDLQSSAAAAKKGIGDLQAAAAEAKRDIESVRAAADETKQGVAGLQRELPRTAKSTEVTPVASAVADVVKRIALMSKTQFYQGQTLNEINGACRKR